jgi:hypothetical protein
VYIGSTHAKPRSSSVSEIVKAEVLEFDLLADTTEGSGDLVCGNDSRRSQLQCRSPHACDHLHLESRTDSAESCGADRTGGGVDLTVENVGPFTQVNGFFGSYIVFRPPDGLTPGELLLTVMLNGNMSNITILSISP